MAPGPSAASTLAWLLSRSRSYCDIDRSRRSFTYPTVILGPNHRITQRKGHIHARYGNSRNKSTTSSSVCPRQRRSVTLGRPLRFNQSIPSVPCIIHTWLSLEQRPTPYFDKAVSYRNYRGKSTRLPANIHDPSTARQTISCRPAPSTS